MGVASDALGGGKRLARRARPDKVKPVQIDRQSIGLPEGKRIVRLRLNIDAYNLEARAMQPHARPARTAKEVERPHVFIPFRKAIASRAGGAGSGIQWVTVTSGEIGMLDRPPSAYQFGLFGPR